MARGGRKTPPNNRSPVVTRSRSDTNVTLETTTTSNDTPDIPVEPVTPLPQGIDVQEIVHQSLIRTQSALSHIRQPGRQLNQPLDFTNLQEQLQGTGLPRNTLGDNITNPVEALILGAGGSGIPPSPPGSSPPSSGGESSDEGSSSSEPSQPSTPPTPMENQNNPARPWLDQDVVVVPGPQHPLPKHPEKWLPKFDPDSKQSAEDHIKKFMLVVRLQSVEHEDVMCRLFPYTFEGNASTWYFSQQPQTIVSWDKFETCFLEKFGDDKSPEVLVMELSSLKMNPKEKVKDFNQRFLTLKKKIPVDSMPAENLIVAYYTKALHNNIAIWVKRSKKNTLLEAFEEASQIEKDILSLKDNLSSEAETTSSSKKKIEILTRPPQVKNQQETLDLESLQKAFQKLSNQVVDLKRSTEEASTSKGSFKPPFRKPFPPNRPNPTTEGLNFESLQYALQTILEAHDNFVSVPPENSDDTVEEEVPEEEDSSPPIFGHLSDNIFQANFETVHPYNTRSKTQNKSPPETSKNVFSKQPKQTETRQNLAAPVLEYDLIEDLKKLRENIYVFELLKFPLILQKMLQSIAENSKKNDVSSKKSAEIDLNTTKNVPSKKTSENQDKRDLSEKTVGNLDKTVSGTTIKNQQNSVVSARKNVPPFLLTFEIFNRNVHNCMVDSGASSNVMPLSVCQKINAEVKPSDLKIIQLDRTNVKVIGELKNVLIRLSSNPKVHQVIDIIVVDIPEVYGLVFK
jgi:hypothetical protein